MCPVRSCVLLPTLVLFLSLPCRGQGGEGARHPTDRSVQPNIILLTVDTLRADHIGLYGYERDTMPAIGEFAKSAVVFDNAVVPRGLTRPSYASMLTGLYPYRHGVRSNMVVAHSDLTTLPELLRSAGYHTAGFVGNFALDGGMSGLDQGFDVYDDDLEEHVLKKIGRERTAGPLVRAVLKWLDTDPPQPWLLFTNFMDPHGPYLPPKRFRELYHTQKTRLLKKHQISPMQYVDGQLNFYDYVDRYDGEIRYTDHAIGTLIDALKRRGLWDDALVVFTADHGECFGEHHMVWFEHHPHVWEASTRVPLAVRLPRSARARRRAAPKRVAALSSPMDLLPTILELLKLPRRADLDGQSLLPLLQGSQEQRGGRHLLLEFSGAESDWSPLLSLPFDAFAIRTATHKLIHVVDRGQGKVQQEMLYDLTRDPMELAPVRSAETADLRRTLANELAAMVARLRNHKLPFVRTVHGLKDLWEGERGGNKVKRKMMTNEQAERLRALGYLH